MNSNTTSSSLSFEERIKQKQRQGFDTKIQHKSELAIRKERSKEVINKINKQKESVSKNTNKKQPKARFSKLPVSIIRSVFGDDKDGVRKFRDPRFDNKGTKTGMEGFDKKYDFVAEQQ